MRSRAIISDHTTLSLYLFAMNTPFAAQWIAFVVLYTLSAGKLAWFYGERIVNTTLTVATYL